MLSKNKIKKFLKHPKKARCPECDWRMIIKNDTQIGGKLKKYFICQNRECGNVVDISNYRMGHNGKYYKEKRNLSEWEREVWEPKIEKEDKILEITRFKLGDKFYKIDDKLEYNPVTRIRIVSGLTFTEPAKDTLHNELVDKIQTILSNNTK